MEKVFRIRHKETGLFFKPAPRSRDINLSVEARTYWYRISLKSMERLTLKIGYGAVGLPWNGRPNARPILRQFKMDEWELVEGTLEEAQKKAGCAYETVGV